LALGRAIIQNLELGARGGMLERWFAHHLAELTIAAETEVGPAKAEVEARAADLILRLWARRRDLPAAADPLGEYRKAIEVLSHLMPDANPWSALGRRGGQEQIFRELFDCMTRVVVGGLVLTLANLPRPVAPAEEAAMEQEELALRKQLDWWSDAIRPAPPRIYREFVDGDDLQADDPDSADQDQDMQGDTNAELEQAEHLSQGAHEAVIRGLQTMRDELDILIKHYGSSIGRRNEGDRPLGAHHPG
jgi:hypothetical protein